MENIIPAIRLLHILFGAFWAGAVFFQVLILEPRLKALGPKMQQPVMGAIMPLLVPAMAFSALAVFATGTTMTLYLRSGMLDTLLTSGWGMAIVVGAAATLGAMAVGIGGLTPTGIRLGKLGEQLNGQPPTPEQAALLTRLSRRMDTLSRLDFALVFIALASMPLARFL